MEAQTAQGTDWRQLAADTIEVAERIAREAGFNTGEPYFVAGSADATLAVGATREDALLALARAGGLSGSAWVAFHDPNVPEYAIRTIAGLEACYDLDHGPDLTDARILRIVAALVNRVEALEAALGVNVAPSVAASGSMWDYRGESVPKD